MRHVQYSKLILTWSKSAKIIINKEEKWMVCIKLLKGSLQNKCNLKLKFRQ